MKFYFHIMMRLIISYKKICYDLILMFYDQKFFGHKATFFAGVSYKDYSESAIKKIIPGYRYRPFYVTDLYLNKIEFYNIPIFINFMKFLITFIMIIKCL